MILRNWIDLVEGLTPSSKIRLDEMKWVQTIKHKMWKGVGQVEIFRNPSKIDLHREREFRALIDKNGDLLVWAADILHSEVDTHLNALRPHLYLFPKQLAWNEIESYKKEDAWDRHVDRATETGIYEPSLLVDFEKVVSNPNLIRLYGEGFVPFGIDESEDFDMTRETIERLCS